MDFDASTLPETPEELKGVIVDLQQAHEQETAILLQQIRLLRAPLFGAKSEKAKLGDAQPLPQFDMPEPEEIEGEEVEIHVPAYERKKRGRRPLPEGLPLVEKIDDIDEEDKVCGCGCQLSRIAEEISEQLDVIPARVQAICHIRSKYACKSCEGVKDDGPTVTIAPFPP